MKVTFCFFSKSFSEEAKDLLQGYNIHSADNSSVVTFDGSKNDYDEVNNILNKHFGKLNKKWMAIHV